MFKNRFLLVLGVISLLSVTMAVSFPRSTASQAASDFYQRHPNWTWAVNPQNDAISVTADSAFPDYFQRHPELTATSILGLEASDYFMRHPELTAPADASVDMTDYYFRVSALQSTTNQIDLTDYFFRHP